MNAEILDATFNPRPRYWQGKDLGSMLNCEADYIPAHSRYTCRGCPQKIRGEACIRTGESGSAFYHPDCYYELIRLLQHKLEQFVPNINEEVIKKHE